MLSRSLDFSTSEEDSSYLEPGTSFFGVITIKVSVSWPAQYRIFVLCKPCKKYLCGLNFVRKKWFMQLK